MTAPRPERPEDVRVEQHIGLVHAVLKRTRLVNIARDAGLSPDDLVQEAAIAMLRARRTWDPAIASWGTYAGLWIRQACQRYIANHGATVRVPVHAQERRRKRGDPSRPTVHSLNHPVDDGAGSASHIDLLASSEQQPEAQLELERLVERTPDLTDRERQVISMRARGRTLEQIGAELGVTRERARQIEAGATLRIREQLVRDGDLERVEVPRVIATMRAQQLERERLCQRQMRARKTQAA